MGWFSRPTVGRDRCGTCAHFCNDSDYLEAVFKGMTSFSSGYASVRAEDGLCTRHDRYLGARSSCPDFAPRDATR
jgi:hypothetical protein